MGRRTTPTRDDVRRLSRGHDMVAFCRNQDWDVRQGRGDHKVVTVTGRGQWTIPDTRDELATGTACATRKWILRMLGLLVFVAVIAIVLPMIA